jgi:hypothetical protein
MFCPKCGTEIQVGNVCPRCNYVIGGIAGETPPTNVGENTIPPIANQNKVKITLSWTPNKIYFPILAAIIFISFWYVASKLRTHGLEIGYIRSVGGNSIDEAYYQEIGNVIVAMSILLKSLGTVFACLLSWFGFKK